MSDRWLVTGAAGMLGRDIVDVLTEQRTAATAAPHHVLDITDADAVRAAVARHEVVVNAAAWTDVDQAEIAEGRARWVNVVGPMHLARACAETGARLIHVSTDYVFDGSATHPYSENATTAPINAYGRSKLAGERVVRDLLPATSAVVRSSWLYGRHGRNFVRTIARLAREREVIDVVDDQHGQPTWTYDLAEQIIAMVNNDVRPGIWHATNSGETTWCGLARAVLEELGDDPDRVRPVSSDAFPRPASRPSYSVLKETVDHRAGIEPMRPWRAALAAAATEWLHQSA